MGRTAIPKSGVSVDYENVLNSFISSLTEKQSDNIRSIFLTGSYSRGDATDSSDLDLWCVFNRIDCRVLNDVGASVRELSVSDHQIGINSQCLSIEEFESVYFSKWTEKPVKVLDSILLYGEDLIGDHVSVSDVEIIYKIYLAEVLLGIRHYICVDKPVEKLTYQRIKTYILKPLMFPLRLERWCALGYYPLSNTDLRKSYDNNTSELVEYFLNQEKFENDIRSNHKAVLYKMHDLVEELLA